MTTHTMPSTELGPVIRPGIQRPLSMRLAAAEYQRVIDLVETLGAPNWSRATDCADWNVRQLVAHIAGMTAFVSTPWELARQMRVAQSRRQDGQQLVDAQTAAQVAERATAQPEELLAELRSKAPRAARLRRRLPGVLRRLAMPEPQLVNGVPETWSLGYLVDVILTRDPWMHRLDLARATGRTPLLTADHDGVIVADVVAEWAQRHGQPYALTLTGPAGGRWSGGRDGEVIERDAADFCRVVAGRPGADGRRPRGLLTTQVPF